MWMIPSKAAKKVPPLSAGGTIRYRPSPHRPSARYGMGNAFNNRALGDASCVSSTLNTCAVTESMTMMFSPFGWSSVVSFLRTVTGPAASWDRTMRATFPSGKAARRWPAVHRVTLAGFAPCACSAGEALAGDAMGWRTAGGHTPLGICSKRTTCRPTRRKRSKIPRAPRYDPRQPAGEHFSECGIISRAIALSRTCQTGTIAELSRNRDD